MTSEIASMLDELMGRNRNDTTGKATAKLEFTDPDVCQFYLCGFCPNELFVNTKADLGPCKKIHDENLRREYQASQEVFKLGFEEKFFDFLQECMIEVERKIKRNKQRLDQNQDEDAPINAETAEHANKLSLLSIEITNLLVEVERLGELGEVQQAMAKTEEVDKLKEDRERIRLATKVNANPDQAYHGQQEKQMEVCGICGSFLIVGDVKSRVDDHLTGKQHMGYARIKAKMNELKEIFDKKREERGERRKSPSKTADRRDEREKRTSRERDSQRRDSRQNDDRRDSRDSRRRRSRDRDDRRRRDDRDRKRDRRRSRSRSGQRQREDKRKHRDDRRQRR